MHIYAASSQSSGTSWGLNGCVAGSGAGAATGVVRTGAGDGTDRTGVFALSGVAPHELGAGLVACGGRVTTDVHPRPADGPAAGCATGAGEAREEPGRDSGCSPEPGERKSASLPKPPPDAWPMAADKVGLGIRESMRRMSCTLRCGSWSTICVSMR